MQSKTHHHHHHHLHKRLHRQLQSAVLLISLLLLATIEPTWPHPFDSDSQDEVSAASVSALASMRHYQQQQQQPLASHHQHHQSYPANSQHPHLQNRYQQQGMHLQASQPSEDYYEYRHIFASAVGRALDECRQKFKWDRWNCPKKAFLSILDRDEAGTNGDLLPTNKELGLTRALIASSTVLSMIKSCSYGTSRLCNCSVSSGADASTYHLYEEHRLQPAPASHQPNHEQHHQLQAFENRTRRHAPLAPSLSGDLEVHHQASLQPTAIAPVILHENSKFVWTGCEETVRFAFKVSRRYLDQPDEQHSLDEASRLINEHNYRAGRLAVRRMMRRKCKCHGVSGTCQLKTCWTVVPSLAEIGDHLRSQYQMAAKVGASSTNETDPVSLSKELGSINAEKLVFADPSPDYCYENKRLGVNGTLERYCSRSKVRDGLETSRTERTSCDRLCTKCGYKIERVKIRVERQCECRFVYCCSVECKRCPVVEEAYKCVRHS